MTSVILNKIGMDLVDVEVSQRGRAETDMFFQDPVLDYTRDYVVGVSELTVPLGAEPMMSDLKNNETLFRVRRKAYVAVADGAITPVSYGVVGSGSAADSPANPDNMIEYSWGKFKCKDIQTAPMFYDELRKYFVNLQYITIACSITLHRLFGVRKVCR